MESARRGSNPRPSAWEADALPTELLAREAAARRSYRPEGALRSTILEDVRRSVSWAVIAICAALVGLLSYGRASSGSSTSLDEALSRGDRPEVAALEQSLPVLGGGGRSGSPADYEGKVVLVNFWASWCDPCKDELPLLQRTHERLARQGGLVLGIDSRDLTEDALSTVSRYGLTFPNLRDRDAVLGREIGAVAYPETIVLDRKGRVAALRRGPVTPEWLDRVLPPLLEEKA